MRTSREKIGKKIRRTWLAVGLVTVLAVTLLPALSARAASEEEKTVRVGYFEQCGFIEKQNGSYSGYAVEYLEKIAYFSGVNYEFVE